MGNAVVGRTGELGTIEEFLARADWPRTLLLSGEAGMGKTVLWHAAAGRQTEALAAFEQALVLHDATPIPFDRARTLLALGAARRRAKERRAARAALEEARDVFGALEARIWERRAKAELGRVGGRAPSAGELTPIAPRPSVWPGRGGALPRLSASGGSRSSPPDGRTRRSPARSI